VVYGPYHGTKTAPGGGGTPAGGLSQSLSPSVEGLTYASY